MKFLTLDREAHEYEAMSIKSFLLYIDIAEEHCLGAKRFFESLPKEIGTKFRKESKFFSEFFSGIGKLKENLAEEYNRFNCIEKLEKENAELRKENKDYKEQLEEYSEKTRSLLEDILQIQSKEKIPELLHNLSSMLEFENPCYVRFTDISGICRR
jgi:hypothetical protein